jgi:hypothetical protein
MRPIELIALDLSAEDEATVLLRLDQEIPDLALAGVSHVVIDLGDLAPSRATADAVALAHRELCAVGGRLVVVTNQAGARQCARACPEMIVAATMRQAHDALGVWAS